MPVHVTDDQLRTALNAYREEGNNASAAARKLGLAISTVKDRLRQASRRGLEGTVAVAQAAPGRHIQGVSTLYGPDGDIKAQWIKERADAKSIETLQASIDDVFSEYRGYSTLPPAPDEVAKDLLTVYPIADQHLGLYAWGEEAGDDYDLDIGAALLRHSMRQLVASSPPSAQALILNLGDFFHSDTNKNQTANSGNSLDVDTRYAKVIKTGIQLMMECIELALQKHQSVKVSCLPGNHDEHSAICLQAALGLFFENNKRVTVDPSPARVFNHRFGKVMIAATHGDMIKMNDLPAVMAAYWGEMWGATKYRYGYTGHVHHNSKTKLEHSGAQCESFQTLAAKDAWHRSSGYSSGRSMVSITHHVEKGEFARCTVSI